MKRVFIALLVLSSTISMTAQDNKWGTTSADSVKCWENYNIFGSMIQTKAYTDAYEHWLQVYETCPGANKSIYIYAPRVLKAMIKEAATEEDKMKYADLLISSYDKRLEYFPGKDAYVTGEKANALMKYKKDVPGAYAAYTQAYELDSKLMSPSQINGYFLSTVRTFNDKNIELDKLIHVYLRCQEAIAENRIVLSKKIATYVAKEEGGEALSKKEAKSKASAEKNLEAYQTVEKNIEKAIGPLLSCQNLALIVNDETFEANKDNKKWLGRAAKMLQKERLNEDGESEDCTDNPLFTKIAETMLALEPSAGGYRAMAKMNYKKKGYSKAAEYYKQAIELEEDPDVLYKDYLSIATCYKQVGSLSSAKTYTVKAKGIQPNKGDAYILLATIYAEAAGSCGENVVEKNGVYWAAINQCAKAKSVDPSSASKANKLIEAFKKGVPQKSIAFQLNYTEGQKLSLGCWINETVTIKFY